MTTVSPSQLLKARRAIRLTFLFFGVVVAGWAPMVPVLKTRLALDEATLGLVLLSMGLGSLVMMPCSSLLIHHIGTRRLVKIGGLLLAVFLPVLALASSTPLLAISLVGFSMTLAAVDIAMNAQAIEVDKLGDKPVLSNIHGLYSIGGVIGAVAMSGLLKAGLPLLDCAVIIAAVLLIPAMMQSKHLLSHEHDALAPEFVFPRPQKRLLGLGAIATALFIAEGMMLDWSAVLLNVYRGFDTAASGYGFAGFSLTMAIGRLLGDRFIHRFGSVMALRSGVLVTILGLLVAVWSPWNALGLIGFAIVGIGLSNTVPIVFAACGRIPDLPSTVALPMVAMLGIFGQLGGPPAIGFVAAATNLPTAFTLVCVLLLGVALAARTVAFADSRQN